MNPPAKTPSISRQPFCGSRLVLSSNMYFDHFSQTPSMPALTHSSRVSRAHQNTRESVSV